MIHRIGQPDFLNSGDLFEQLSRYLNNVWCIIDAFGELSQFKAVSWSSWKAMAAGKNESDLMCEIDKSVDDLVLKWMRIMDRDNC